MPSSATRVTTAASHGSLPRRVAMRSAIDVALLSRASRTRRTMKCRQRVEAMAPMKVGGSGQP